jgi:GTP cyclohydrolase FolE2
MPLQGLYLKPIARLNVSVQLPQLKKSGAKISNWEVMERVKEMAKPFTFPVFKVSKSSLEFVRFEAEIENYGSMEQVRMWRRPQKGANAMITVFVDVSQIGVFLKNLQ